MTSRQSGRRTGILGGTFDPVHNGHLAVARLALERLKLDRVMFIPAARPPHKRAGAITSFAHRAAMLELALGAEPCFELCRIEEKRPGPSYSIDTLRQLRRLFADDRFFFIIGLDAFAEIDSWKEWRQLPRFTSFAVINRSGPEKFAGREIIPRLFPRCRQEEKNIWSIVAGGKICFLDMEPLPVSSTRIRTRIRAGRSVNDLTPAAVADYIYRNHLYR